MFGSKFLISNFDPVCIQILHKFFFNQFEKYVTIVYNRNTYAFCKILLV